MSVKDNLSQLQKEIAEACQRVGRDPAAIEIVAVTKYSSVDRAKEALEAGITNLGESRDSGFLEKWTALKDNQVRWHFIGSLQSRKVRDIINHVDYVHSLDRISLAKEIQKRSDKPVNCLVQVNVSGEESKFGLSPEEVLDFIKGLEAYDKINVVGLMTMAPFTEDEAVIRKCFKKLKEIQTEVIEMNLTYAPCDQLSMGMSNDFQIAIEEGATMIRVGSSLVGN